MRLRSHRRPRSVSLPPRVRPAAGVLLSHTDASGEVWWLLGKRHHTLGGAWSNLGGSLERGEHPLLGALRELAEETRFPPTCLAGATITHVLECGDATRPYTMFVFDVPRLATGAVLNWEHTDLAWFPTAEVDLMGEKRRLHPPFADSWTALQTKVAS